MQVSSGSATVVVGRGCDTPGARVLQQRFAGHTIRQ